jgi:dienelactone hydrolase
VLTKLANNVVKTTAFLAVLALARTVGAAAPETIPVVVELETPLSAPQPLQGFLRQPGGAGRSPAVVLLHACNGNWRQLDERWGKRIASWGYVTLTVDSFGPRGLQNTCTSGAPTALAFDAYRALDFLVQKPFVDPTRVAALGFSQGGWLTLTSVERGIVEKVARNKFRAAVAFYPPCLDFKDDMTVPTLILIGELDDWTPAAECRNMAEGRDDYGISRHKGDGLPIQLIVYPGAYHSFDSPSLHEGVDYFGHHLQFNPAASDQSVDDLRRFLYATIGGKEQRKGVSK